MDRSRPFPHATVTDPSPMGRMALPWTRIAALALLGLVGGCAARPRLAPAPVAQALPPAVKHVATRRTAVRAAPKVCVPEAPALNAAQRDELFRQFQQEQAKRAGE